MLDIRVIAKVEGDSSRRLAIRVCGLIQITFAIALLNLSEFVQKILPWLKSNKAFVATDADFEKVEK